MTFNQIEYSQAARHLADRRYSAIIPNSGPVHARIAMQNIFRTAENYVYIFAGNLNGEVSKGNYLRQLESCLAEKGKSFLLEEGKKRNFFSSLRILFSKGPAELLATTSTGKGLDVRVILCEPIVKSEALNMLQRYARTFPQRIKVGFLNFEDSAKIVQDKFGGEMHHFTVADDRMYREEFDTKDYFAKVNFNGPDKSMDLKKLFLSLKTFDLL